MKKKVSNLKCDSIESLQEELKALKKRVEALDDRQHKETKKAGEKLRSDSFRFVIRLNKLIKDLPPPDELNRLIEMTKDFFHGFF